jgi:hypothetical protein
MATDDDSCDFHMHSEDVFHAAYEGNTEWLEDMLRAESERDGELERLVVATLRLQAALQKAQLHEWLRGIGAVPLSRGAEGHR